jgi:hypothetical protein
MDGIILIFEHILEIFNANFIALHRGRLDQHLDLKNGSSSYPQLSK